MRPRRTMGFITKINMEIFPNGHTTIFHIAIDDQHNAALVLHAGIELIIPSLKQGGGDKQAFPVKGQLNHLRSTIDRAPVHLGRLAKQSAYPHLSRKFGV